MTNESFDAHDFPRPAARLWIIESIWPAGCVISLYGDSGLGKSYFGIYLQQQIVTGAKLLDKLATTKRPVLYIDAELDGEEYLRRSWDIAQGSKHPCPPKGMNYYRLDGSLLEPETQEAVAAEIAKYPPDTVKILDSMGLALAGSDFNDASHMTKAMQMLYSWGSTLVLDHISNSAAAGNQSEASEFGSAYKRASARSRVQLIRGPAGALQLDHKKSNFGALLSSPIYFSKFHDIDEVYFHRVEPTDPSMTGMESQSKAVEQVYLAIARLGATDAKGIAGHLEALGIKMTEKTIRNHCTPLHKAHRIEMENGRYWIDKEK